MQTRSTFKKQWFSAGGHFAQKVLILFLVLILFSQQTAAKAANLPILFTLETIHAPGDQTYTVVLPLIVVNDPTIPLLIYPADSAVLDTLIPVFQWDLGIQPNDAYGCLSIKTQPDQLNCENTFYNMSQFQSFDNLEPGAIYYWRVGVIINQDSSHPKWSEIRSFTSGPAGGPIPLAPTLLAPADNALLDIPQWIFSWTPVDGALDYAFYVSDQTTLSTSLFSATETQEDFRFMIGQFFTVGHPYEWFVRARNHYAWGTASLIRHFQVSHTQ